MDKNESWKQHETIKRYQRTADITIPRRKDILRTIAKLASTVTSVELNVLDMGCGTGDVSEEILKIRPDASICMVDYSEGMIQLARDRFSNSGNVSFYTHDLNNGIPKELQLQKFDVVTSCFALHHIEYENRAGLYTQIHRLLRNDGLFIIGDILIKESPMITEWELDQLIGLIVEQAKNKMGIERTFDQVKQRHLDLARETGDKPGTFQDMQNDLKQAGFQCVDCVLMENRHAIIAATNR